MKRVAMVAAGLTMWCVYLVLRTWWAVTGRTVTFEFDEDDDPGHKR